MPSSLPETPSRQARLAAGFADPVAGAQATFRALLETAARPGRVETLTVLPDAPAGVAPAFAAACLSLLDADTVVWLDRPAEAALAPWLAFHCGCPTVRLPGEADFALVLDPAGLPPLEQFRRGTPEAPEDGAAVLLQVAGIAAPASRAAGWTLTGPGIAAEARLAVEGLPMDFAGRRIGLEAAYPCGLDFYFFCGPALAALPRSTRLRPAAAGV